jgi:uncharacterized glyoxalase superfamily protein PhnB
VTDPRDPFEQLARPIEPQTPRPTFARELRTRLVAELGLTPTIDLPRRAAMTDAPTGTTTETTRATRGGIWAGVSYRDALAGIRFLVEVLGFEEQLVVTDPADPGTVVHSQMRWPEGGILQAATYVADNEFVQAPGAQAVYVITADPQAVWERCQAAGVEVVRPPESPDYDPEGMGFSIRDPEGNIFSFGTYAGEA